MKRTDPLRIALLLVLWLISSPTQASQAPGLYTSSILGLGPTPKAFSIRVGLGDVNDIAATFLDADADLLVDGFLLETISSGTPGSQTHGFASTQVNGVNYLAFPLVSSSNFPLSAASFVPGLPATALPLVPMTPQGTIAVTRSSNGAAILTIPLMIDPELLSNVLFGDGFETPVPAATGQ